MPVDADDVSVVVVVVVVVAATAGCCVVSVAAAIGAGSANADMPGDLGFSVLLLARIRVFVPTATAVAAEPSASGAATPLLLFFGVVGVETTSDVAAGDASREESSKPSSARCFCNI